MAVGDRRFQNSLSGRIGAVPSCSLATKVNQSVISCQVQSSLISSVMGLHCSAITVRDMISVESFIHYAGARKGMEDCC